MAIISPEPDEKFARLMNVGGGMFREGFRYALATISLEFIAQAEAQRLDGTLHRNPYHLDGLKQVMKDLVAKSTERIRQGDTNIKGHVFLSMVMAQVDAIEAGVPGDLKIARNAKESVDLCYSLLQEQASIVTDIEFGSSPSDFDAGQRGFELDWDLEFFLPDAEF
ncbi:uncharacterized protein ColSpa_09215 [Colletotrichum spaethianum]|uniref:Uncharacterized protein n=1 Tax=Colletotrichum spaethianum TaxID=700344 RepID=A0AA37UJ29_9PEZI|nr:uncharacterized protein ColSpa_09215 [Colletotrichum spaethianum]GKT49034.1 hypothetical protein ColSpa_09215 [Colletotrichum spaethianum]